MPKRSCKIKIVLIDLDGTLTDTMSLLAERAAEIISKALGISKESAKKMYLSLAGRPFREQLKLLGVPKHMIEPLALEFEEFKREILRGITLNPLVLKRLKGLRERRLKVVLSTNSECSVVKENKNLKEVFDMILCHDPSTGERKGKSHLDIVRRIFNVDVCEVVFIGDSDYDIELYRSLGVKTYRTRGLWDPEDSVVEEILGKA